MDICVVNTPILQSVSTSIAEIPYFPEALWLHEVIGPVIFDLSLTDTNLKVRLTISWKASLLFLSLRGPTMGPFK